MQAAVATPPLVPRLLAEYGDMTRIAVRRFIAGHEPRRHLYDLIGEYPARGGKMMRPSLCIATARAFGANLDEALPTAAAIEILHNALLIHDDIQDESETRRGLPALHHLCGVPLAINAGDTLTLSSVRPLLENTRALGPRAALAILHEVERMARESAEGQALELGWRHDNTLELDADDYLVMVLKKTCWLGTIFPCRAGAIIGSRRVLAPESFTRFGFFLGSAFQIQDDILNLLADDRYGKERDGDLYEGKRTLIVLRVWDDADSAGRERIARLFALPRADKPHAEVRWLRHRIDACGAIDYARDYAHGLAGAALAEFESDFGACPPSRDRDFIEGLASWVFERQ